MLITDNLTNEIKEGKYTKAILNDGSKVRIFISTGGVLCKFLPRSKRRGVPIFSSSIASLIEAAPKKSPDELEFALITKFRKQAAKATFNNEFITQCCGLPSTYEAWERNGKQSAYEYGVTTGCSVTGQLISVDAVAKGLQYKFSKSQAEFFLDAIKEKKTYHSPRFPFQGYEATVELRKEDNNVFRGFLSKEYKGCANGYYFLLINDKYFIGYDKD